MSETVTVSETVPQGSTVLSLSSRAALNASGYDNSDPRDTEEILIVKNSDSLGIKIIGGAYDGQEREGIFVKRLFSGGAAASDGRLQEGDKILRINGVSAVGLSNDDAVTLLTRAWTSGSLKLLVQRGEVVRSEFLTIQNARLALNSSTNSTVASVASRTSTPTIDESLLSDSELFPELSLSTLAGSHIHGSLDRNKHSSVSKWESTGIAARASDNRSLDLDDLTSLSPVPMATGTHHVHPGRPLSLDPQVRLRVEKLEEALRYLGLRPSEGQQQELRNRLTIDGRGTVAYGEFVQIAKELFKEDLEPGLSSSINAAAGQSYVPNSGSTAAQLQRENESLRREMDKMSRLLKEKDRACTQLENELVSTRRKLQEAMHENNSLQSSVNLAAAAQQQAVATESSYMEVLTQLEKEIQNLRLQQKKPLETSEVQKRLAYLSSQVSKAEASKKRYEVATERLLHFAENVQGALQRQLPSLTSKGISSSGTLPSNKNAKVVQHLVLQARDVIKAVRLFIEEEPLPPGWDEAYTEDGLRYFINHVTQTTSWTHPVSHVQKNTPLPSPTRQPASTRAATQPQAKT